MTSQIRYIIYVTNTPGDQMARINKALLRKAKSQLMSAAKSGDETAAEMLAKRKNRKLERKEAVQEGGTEKPTTTVGWNFTAGELVRFKTKRQRWNNVGSDCYIIIGTKDSSGRNHVETGSVLEITGPNGILVVQAAWLKKV